MIRLFKVFIPVGTLTLLVSEAVLVTSAFIFATYLALEVDPTVFLLYDGGLTRILLVLLSILIGLHFHDLYSQFHVKSRIVLVQQLCLVMGVAFLTQGFIAYLNAGLRVPIRVMVVGSGLAVIAIFFWRVFFSTYALHVVGRDRLLLVGGSPLLEDIAKHVVDHPEAGLMIAGYVDDRHQVDQSLPGGKSIGNLSQLRDIVRATQPHRIVVGMFERRNRMPMGDLLELRFAGHIIEEVANTYERVCGRVCLKEIRPSQLIFSGELGPRPQNLIYQRMSNMAVAGFGIILSSPIMLLTALAVKLSSPGPVLYRQTRVGLDDSLFTVYKFRSMRVDAEAATGAVWAQKDDPRRTRFGTFLRSTSLDELPQLFNVLMGDMSLVGPRPERPVFIQKFARTIPSYMARHRVKAGITGWAQVNGWRGNTSLRKRVQYDLYYITHWTPWLDLRILWMTVFRGLVNRNAY